MKDRLALALTLFLALTVTPVAAQVAAPALPLPTSLAQRASGQPVPPAGWIRQSHIELQFKVAGTGAAIVPQIELRRVAEPLRGVPTQSGAPLAVATGQTRLVTFQVRNLRAGSYRWQARIVDQQGNDGDWVEYAPPGTGPAFSVDTAPPGRPVISSPTNPRWGAWYRTRTETFNWHSVDPESGIAGYAYTLNHTTSGSHGSLTPQTRLTLHNLRDGKWVLHVWARDRAGNWSASTSYKFNLDTIAPTIAYVSSSNHTFNPYTTLQIWQFSLDQGAHVVVQVRRSGQATAVRVQDLGTLRRGTNSYTWNGRDRAGQLVPAGWYWLHVFATDGVGNVANKAFGGIHVQPIRPIVKRIVISLSQQTIAAYQDGRLVWSSLATTGNSTLTPTPAGHYAIFARYSPYEFVSPWPYGHPYWYASAWSTYAMEFIRGGYFIHDAPWRSVFGPASQQGGQPGTDYGGTHGCVNVPFGTAEFLWNWAPIGTTVDVVP